MAFLSILHIQSEKGASAPQNAGARHAGQAGQRERGLCEKAKQGSVLSFNIFFEKHWKNRKDML